MGIGLPYGPRRGTVSYGRETPESGRLASFADHVVHSKNKQDSYKHIGGYFDRLRAAGRDRPLVPLMEF